MLTIIVIALVIAGFVAAGFVYAINLPKVEAQLAARAEYRENLSNMNNA